jgi:DNA-binding MarR family transcriptional regulator
LSSGTVTGVIDRLEQLQFVHRDRHPSDRRKVLVVLDERQVAERLAPLFADQGAALERAIKQFRKPEQEAIARFLEVLGETPDAAAAEG